MQKSMKGKAAKSSGLKKQTKIVMAKALEEDPTVFQVVGLVSIVFEQSYRVNLNKCR